MCCLLYLKISTDNDNFTCIYVFAHLFRNVLKSGSAHLFWNAGSTVLLLNSFTRGGPHVAGLMLDSVITAS